MDRKRAWLIFHNLDAAKLSLPPEQIMDAIRTIAEMPTHATVNKFEVVKVIWYLLDTHNAQSTTKEELIDVIKVLLPEEGEQIGKEKN